MFAEIKLIILYLDCLSILENDIGLLVEFVIQWLVAFECWL
jgi:hypothetical protein